MDRLEHAPARHRRLAVARRGERVAQVLRDVLQRPDVQVRSGVLDRLPQIDARRCSCVAFCRGARWPARRPKTVQSSSELPIIRLRPWVPPAISPQAKSPCERRLAVLVDHEAAVLVVQDGVGEDRLAQRVDARPHGSGAACTGARSRRRARDRAVVSSSTAGRPSGVSTPRPVVDLVEDRLRDDVARAERVGELARRRALSSTRTVRAGRLRDRVALHRRRPGAAVRVVLQRVEVAGLGAELERDPRHLAGRAGVVRRELAALLGLAVAAPARSEHDRAGVDLQLVAVLARQRRAPAVLGAARARRSGRVGRASRPLDGRDGVAQRRRDRVARCGRRPAAGACASRRRSGPAGSRRCSRVNSTPSSSSQSIAAGASPVSTSTSRGRPSRASSARRPRRAARASRPRRTPPGCRPAPWRSCTTASEPLVASATRAPARSAETRGREPGGAAADHEHVECRAVRPRAETYPNPSD